MIGWSHAHLRHDADDDFGTRWYLRLCREWHDMVLGFDFGVKIHLRIFDISAQLNCKNLCRWTARLGHSSLYVMRQCSTEEPVY